MQKVAASTELLFDTNFLVIYIDSYFKLDASLSSLRGEFLCHETTFPIILPFWRIAFKVDLSSVNFKEHRGYSYLLSSVEILS